MTVNNNSKNNKKKSILIIGATGDLGRQLLHHLGNEKSKNNIDAVHVMVRNPTKLTSQDLELIESVQKGDATNAKHVEQALRQTQANYVILATGNGLDLGKSNTREETGRSLVLNLIKTEFSHIQCIVMSSHGASESKIIIGFGIGKLITHHLRNVLADHTKQEKLFETYDDVKARTLIVRPTSLTNDKPAKKGLDFIVEFDGTKKGPSINIDRSDVAAWVTREIVTKPTITGRQVCLTNAK